MMQEYGSLYDFNTAGFSPPFFFNVLSTSDYVLSPPFVFLGIHKKRWTTTYDWMVAVAKLAVACYMFQRRLFEHDTSKSVLNKAMDEAKKSPLLNREEALKFLKE